MNVPDVPVIYVIDSVDPMYDVPVIVVPVNVVNVPDTPVTYVIEAVDPM